MRRSHCAWIDARIALTSRKVHMLKLEDFNRLLGQTFSIQNETGENVAAQLIEANALGKRHPTTALGLAERHPFSIIFQAQSGKPLKQQIYQLRHEELGTLEIFLVPIS